MREMFDEDARVIAASGKRVVNLEPVESVCERLRYAPDVAWTNNDTGRCSPTSARESSRRRRSMNVCSAWLKSMMEKGEDLAEEEEKCLSS